ncbi:type II DNA topoisomerase [Basidiobolus meristosporus CBS 931.73]|uniref:DNA topoisomerase 2 n=1 Tax=Basidiobolus meristosporus CBS 931.73 TaxID=1314790 RepID=A0A1Y1X7B9_9FUNG|nr:type II DNA topoisomerase [Basidiobolus meristosporus CBS 931.73]|eukprot:ORX81622.1 type II DNA topoisomerase [Basidiobolus meristosporus CBS 931.73]
MYSDSDDSLFDLSDGDTFEPIRPKTARKAPASKAAASKPAKPAATKAASKTTTSKAPAKRAVKGKAVSSATPTESDDDSAIVSASSSSTQSSTGKKTIEQIYQKKTQLEHILLRPDSYIGSVEHFKQRMWVFDSNQERMVNREIEIVPGLYKIVDELLVNAADNKIRDPTMSTIRVNIDVETSTISVYNDGRGIPIEIHKEEGVYVPELIFGHLLTSSNYDDNDKKVVGGRNGYGAKLCNIFSTEFIVETADKTSGKKYKQVFRDNMTVKEKPIITANTRKEEYTKITFKPDLEKFSMDHIDSDLEALLKKRVYDIAGCIKGSKTMKVFLNDERIKVNTFEKYINLYVDPEEQHSIIIDKNNERWEVGFVVSEDQFQQVSFVNSIATTKGGTHVAYITDQIVAKLTDHLKKPSQKVSSIKPSHIKNHLWVFINCLIENPSFDSQTKENMTLRAKAFGSDCQLSDKFLNSIIKESGVVENITNFIKIKEDQSLKKTDGQKRSRITGIVKLEDANKAGTKDSEKCTLILTEGDSAKQLVLAGLSVVGRDHYGVFPLRGKLLNVRDASHSQIMNNVEINHIKRILGLQHAKTYTNTKGLRYGHLMIMTDQDHDGSHIKGLLINFLDHFFPSLLKVPGFLVEFITPIVKCTKGNKVVSFFTMPEYYAWKETNDNGKGWKVKYYKGLSTSDRNDAKQYFSNLEIHRKFFEECKTEDSKLIDLAFNKKKADDRKHWMSQFKIGTYMDHSVDKIAISDFVNKELILFSLSDNVRSIPSIVDGFKPGQRKVLYTCLKYNVVKDIKVFQLIGMVAEKSAYHHGDASLGNNIIGLAQHFVGSNNINVLFPAGMFGSREQGGKNAGAPRYIETYLCPIARSIFHGDDDPILNYQNEDGQIIEPDWYMPVVPMVLINGAEGIGTGWSTFIPNYNPVDIVDNLRRLMNGERLVKMTPWYRGFQGEIEPLGENKYQVTGVINQVDERTVEITELPIRVWTLNYKTQIEAWMTDKDGFIEEYQNNSGDLSVSFRVTLTEKGMKSAKEEGLLKKFKLVSTITTTNMVCFDKEGRIKKYDSAEEILETFYHIRLSYYQKRKEYMADQLTQDWTKIDNRVRFILEIIEGKLVVQNRKKNDILKDLKTRGYAPFFKNAEKAANTEEEDGEPEKDHGFDYLLSMPIWNLTTEKVDKLIKERDLKESELTALLSLTAKDLWNRDLDAFLEQWDKMQEEDYEIFHPTNAQSQTTSRKPRARKAIGAVKKQPVDEMDFELGNLKAEHQEVKAEEPAKPTIAKRAPAKGRKKPVIKEEDDEDFDFSTTNVTAESSRAPAKKPVATKLSAIDSILDGILSDSDEELKMLLSNNTSKFQTMKDKARSNPTNIPGVKGPDSPAYKKKRVLVKRQAHSVDELADSLSDVNLEEPTADSQPKLLKKVLEQENTKAVRGKRSVRAVATKRVTRYIESSEEDDSDGGFHDSNSDFSE